MTYVPKKPLRFRVHARDGRLLVEPHGGEHDATELAMAMVALDKGLAGLRFVVDGPVDLSDEIPRLAVQPPLRRLWVPDQETRELALKEEGAAAHDDQLLLSSLEARTWRLQWTHGGQTTAVSDAGPPPAMDNLWSPLERPVVNLESTRFELAADGRLLFSGRLRTVNAPPLGVELETRVACGGQQVVAKADVHGLFHAYLEPPSERPPTMSATVSIPLRIGNDLTALHVADRLVETAFRGATVTVDDGPRAAFASVIPGGRQPLAMRFASASYRPRETSLFLEARGSGRRFACRLEEAGDEYRLLGLDPEFLTLFEDEVDVLLWSQREPAGRLQVMPRTLRGRWSIEAYSLTWHPSEETRTAAAATPAAGDPVRPQRVIYRGQPVDVDPTAFVPLTVSQPLQALAGGKFGLRRLASPADGSYDCCVPDDRVVGRLEEIGWGEYRLPPHTVGQLALDGLVLQGADGQEQGLFWAPGGAIADLATYQALPADGIDAAAGRPALVYFRGLYLPVHVRSLVTDGSPVHSMIELVASFALPRKVQVEPFLPLMMHRDDTRVFLWQFGEAPTTLRVRGDGLAVGEGTGADVGYVIAPGTTGSDAYEWLPFPPATEEVTVAYHTWRGYLWRLDGETIRFAGWFLRNHGHGHTYPARPPFAAYRFARRRTLAPGSLVISPKEKSWSWVERSTLPAEDVPLLTQRVAALYPDVPADEADLARLDARERQVESGTRRYLLRPSWSKSLRSLQVTVIEQPQEPSATSGDEVCLFASVSTT